MPPALLILLGVTDTRVWLESCPCMAGLQHCWWVEAVDGQESESRAGEGAWKWLGWGFSW